MGIVLDDLPILEGARLALVGVDAEVDRLLGLLRQEAPLHAGGEARAAAAAQVRRLHQLDQLLGRELGERLPRGFVATVLAIDVELAEAGNVPAAEE